MACLQRGVLTVVGEAEELPRVGAQARLGAVHPAQRAGNQYRGRRAATFGRERGETRAIAGRAALSVPAAETESELARQEPRRRPGTDSPVGRDDETASTLLSVVRLQPQVAAGVELDPRLRVVLVAIVEGEFGIVDRMRCQEAEDLLLGPRLLSISLRLFLPRRRRVVDVPREKDGCPVVAPRQPDRVILVPAFAAEVHGVETLVRMARQELLAIDGYRAGAWRLDRRVGVPGAGDELVELEREEALLAAVRVRGPRPLWNARHQEKVAQRPCRRRRRAGPIPPRAWPPPRSPSWASP